MEKRKEVDHQFETRSAFCWHHYGVEHSIENYQLIEALEVLMVVLAEAVATKYTQDSITSCSPAMTYS